MVMFLRIQSLFLTLSIVSAVVALMFPYSVTLSPESDGVIQSTSYFQKVIDNPQGEISVRTNYIPLSILLLAVFLSVFSLFGFRNRVAQYKLTRFTILIYLALVLYLFYSSSDDTTIMQYKPGIYFPIYSAVLVFLASIFIRKDENLVKAADRLR